KPAQEAFTAYQNLNYSEDCLYLNVWSPDVEVIDDQQLRPVLVWLHGGGLVIGGSSFFIYDGRTLAAMSNAVVVSINYRSVSISLKTMVIISCLLADCRCSASSTRTRSTMSKAIKASGTRRLLWNGSTITFATWAVIHDALQSWVRVREAGRSVRTSCRRCQGVCSKMPS